MTGTQLHVLMPTDVFPPRCGGAGWSAHALALALIGRGHRVRAVVTRQGHGQSREEVLGVPALRYGYFAPAIPFVKNYFRHERFWPVFARVLEAEAHHGQERDSSQSGRLIIHAQHVQVAPAAVMAGRRLGAPVVVTVRDHWPWDYFATGLHGDQIPYQAQTWASLATDLPARLGPARGILALPAIPYIRAHLRRRQSYLRQADAVIAVSEYIAGRLRGIVPPERLHVIPNMLNLTVIDRLIVTPPEHSDAGAPFLLFVGKLERNKGAHLLIGIFRELQQYLPAVNWPALVIAGNGPLRGELEAGLQAVGVRARFLDWAGHDEVLRLMARCDLLLFPSAWGDPLSRVLLEACACSAPILAMPTGGTPSIIRDGQSGALEATIPGFARRLAELLGRPAERRMLGTGSRRMAVDYFAQEVVATQIEELYRQLIVS